MNDMYVSISKMMELIGAADDVQMREDLLADFNSAAEGKLIELDGDFYADKPRLDHVLSYGESEASGNAYTVYPQIAAALGPLPSKRNEPAEEASPPVRRGRRLPDQTSKEEERQSRISAALAGLPEHAPEGIKSAQAADPDLSTAAPASSGRTRAVSSVAGDSAGAPESTPATTGRRRAAAAKPDTADTTSAVSPAKEYPEIVTRDQARLEELKLRADGRQSTPTVDAAPAATTSAELFNSLIRLQIQSHEAQVAILRAALTA